MMGWFKATRYCRLFYRILEAMAIGRCWPTLSARPRFWTRAAERFVPALDQAALLDVATSPELRCALVHAARMRDEARFT